MRTPVEAEAQPTRRDRLVGGLLGLLIGDAVGVPYEFNLPEDLPPRETLELVPPAGFRRSHARIPPGTWSDDGAQALCLLASLLEHNRLDLEDFGHKLLAWYKTGYLAVDRNVFDVGIQTSQALSEIQRGVDAAHSGRSDERANGNGSLMRVLPLALWHQGDDHALVRDAQRQSLPTHGHLRAQVCCALYCLWARCVLQGAANPWPEAVLRLRELYQSQPDALRELTQVIQPEGVQFGRGTGYVVDCLKSAVWAQNAGDFEQVVKAAISLGNDTDTTACVAGGIAGLRFGERGIPARWRGALRGQGLLMPLLEGLLLHHGL